MIFDLIGGSASLLQMVFIAVNNNDVGGVLGNPGKFGTGVVTVVFECLFLVQKYVLYPARKNYFYAAIQGYDPI